MTPRVLWVDQSGRMRCTYCAGGWVVEASEDDPGLLRIRTPIGVWDRVTPQFRAEWEAMGLPVVCNRCGAAVGATVDAAV